MESLFAGIVSIPQVSQIVLPVFFALFNSTVTSFPAFVTYCPGLGFSLNLAALDSNLLKEPSEEPSGLITKWGESFILGVGFLFF